MLFRSHWIIAPTVAVLIRSSQASESWKMPNVRLTSSLLLGEGSSWLEIMTEPSMPDLDGTTAAERDSWEIVSVLSEDTLVVSDETAEEGQQPSLNAQPNLINFHPVGLPKIHDQTEFAQKPEHAEKSSSANVGIVESQDSTENQDQKTGLVGSSAKVTEIPVDEVVTHCELNPAVSESKVNDSPREKTPSFHGRKGAKQITVESSEIGHVYLVELFYDREFYQNYHDMYYYISDEPRNYVRKRRPLIVFGDNDHSWWRPADEKRAESAAQAKGLSNSQMDRSIAYGIVTTFYEPDSAFKKDDTLFEELIRFQFAELTEELKKGSNIIIPVRGESKKYGAIKEASLLPFSHSNKKIWHSLGTGIANLPDHRLRVIAESIADLVQASGKEAVIYSAERWNGIVPYSPERKEALLNNELENTRDHFNPLDLLDLHSPNDRNPDFQVPSALTIRQPDLKNGLTEEFVRTHRVNSSEERSYAFVLLLHWDEQNQQLWTALHRRYDPGHPLAHPGGAVDHYETLFVGAAREVTEEAMVGHYIRPEDLVLLTAHEIESRSKGHFALFGLFLRSKDMITGPDREHCWEMKIDEKNGFDYKTRMRWFRVNQGWLQDLPDDLKNNLWVYLKGALSTLNRQIQVPIGVKNELKANPERTQESGASVMGNAPKQEANHDAREKTPSFHGRKGAKQVTVESSEIGHVYLVELFYDREFYQNYHDLYYDQNGEPKKDVIKRRPLILFGDNDHSWWRPAGNTRASSAAQAAGLSHNLMDRSIAYGIVTTFFDYNSQISKDDNLFEELIQFQFAELTEELKKGSNIIIPVRGESKKYGAIKEASLLPFSHSNKKIWHSLGTGIANLPDHRLRVIAESIADLVQASGKEAVIYSAEQNGIVPYSPERKEALLNNELENTPLI